MSQTQTQPAISPFASRPPYSDAYPLDDFYAARRLPMPAIHPVNPADMPEPYRSLLVHESDMTSRLEKFHKRKIHIRVAVRHTRGGEYFREVALELDGLLKPVEFGAIKINLDLFPSGAREEILREQRPLGGILHSFEMSFSSRPRSYMTVACDSFIGGVLHLSGVGPLFARRNTLFDAWDQPLAEIVEILPR